MYISLCLQTHTQVPGIRNSEVRENGDSLQVWKVPKKATKHKKKWIFVYIYVIYIAIKTESIALDYCS